MSSNIDIQRQDASSNPISESIIHQLRIQLEVFRNELRRTTAERDAAIRNADILKQTINSLISSQQRPAHSQADTMLIERLLDEISILLEENRLLKKSQLLDIKESSSPTSRFSELVIQSKFINPDSLMPASSPLPRDQPLMRSQFHYDLGDLIEFEEDVVQECAQPGSSLPERQDVVSSANQDHTGITIDYGRSRSYYDQQRLRNKCLLATDEEQLPIITETPSSVSRFRGFCPPYLSSHSTGPVVLRQPVESCVFSAHRLDSKSRRAVLISNLSQDIEYTSLLQKIYGGAILSAIITDTTPITKSKTAIITFVNESAASKFAQAAQYAPPVINGVPSVVKYIDNATCRRVPGAEDSRCLRIDGLLHQYNQFNFVESICSAMSHSGQVHLQNTMRHVVCIRYVGDGTVVIEFNSIRIAFLIRATLSRHPHFHYAKFSFDRDPCDQSYPREDCIYQMGGDLKQLQNQSESVPFLTMVGTHDISSTGDDHPLLEEVLSSQSITPASLCSPRSSRAQSSLSTHQSYEVKANQDTSEFGVLSEIGTPKEEEK